MVKLDFYGGVDEIGGNKILLNHNQTSVFLDFGMSFSQSNKYYSEFLQPRKSNGILDFIELGLLPKIKGIYREDYLKHSGLPFDDEASVDGVLLTHAHMDHSAYIHHLRADIPLFLTEDTYFILKVIEETSRVSFTDLITLKKDFHFTPKKKLDGFKRLQGDSARQERDINIMKPYETQEIGDLNVKSAPVDHSLPGATGYIIESDDETIVYTGDLRFHGRNPELTNKFVKECKKANPDIMISEGTRISESSTITEEEVENNIVNHIGDYKGFVAVNYPIRDLDRLQTFYNVAKDLDRTLVVNLKQAYILMLFKGKGYPEIDDVCVYIPKKGWGLIDNDSYACFGDEWNCSSEIEDHHINTDYDKWERNILNLSNTINYNDIQNSPGDYIFRCDFFELKELIDIKPKEGLYIRSVTEPFDDETAMDYKKAINWLDHFNLEMFQMHASGHASGPEILEMIEEIGPKKVYPVHTNQKEKFLELKKSNIDVVYPKLS